MLYCIVWTGIRVVLEFYQIKYSIVVGDIVKTTFELNFDFYQALNSMDTQNYGKKEKLSI